MLKLTQSQLARVRKKQHFSQSLPRGELWTVLRLALAHTVTEIVKNVVSFAHAQVDFALILAYNQYDKIDKWSGAYLSNRVS